MNRKQLTQIFARATRRSPDRAADVIGFLYVILKGVARRPLRSIPSPHWFDKRHHPAQKAAASMLNENWIFRYALRIGALTLLSLLPAGAQTCTPLSFPAIIVQGQTYQPAIVNGIDQVSTNSVRFQYTANTAINAVNIVYATAAQWTVNGNKIVAGTAGTNYSSLLGTQPISSIASGTIFGNNITNLAPNTTYYMAGLASSNAGSTWCPEVDASFTTLPWSGVQKPHPPNTFTITEPTINTDYTLGTAPCNVGATAYAQFIDCITNRIPESGLLAGTNYGIGIVPGTPVVVPAANGPINQWPIPPAAIAVTPNSPTANCWTYSTTNVGGASVSLTNHEQVRFNAGYQNYPPVPINQGVTYSILTGAGVCGGGNTFEASQDGANPLMLTASGGSGTQYILPWPATQGWLVIHSTASPSNLPPAGVRLDPVAYGSQLGIIEGSGPMGSVMNFSFTSHLWFQNIETTVQPNPSASTETDPPPSGFLFQIGTMTDHVIFNQTWEHGPPVPDGLNSNGWVMAGSYNAVVNSVTDDVAFARPSDDLNNGTVSGNVLYLNSGAQGYSGSYYAPSSPTSHYTCSPNPANGITFGGASGSFYVSLVPGTCAVTVTAATGMTASGTGVTLVSVASPTDYPRDANSVCVAAHGKGCYTQLLVGQGTWNGSTLAYSDAGRPAMASDWGSENATGIGLFAGTGPWEILNNFYSGVEIVGPFRDQDFNNGCPGGPQTQCPEIANTIDLTVQRNTIQWDPNFISSSPTWNGSWWFGRNGPEIKQGDRVLYDGNIIGPIYSGLGGGECLDLFTYNGATEGEYAQTPLSEFTGDIEFRNNTCQSSGEGIQMSGGSVNGLMPGWGIHRVWIHNNLFDNTNGYLANPKPPNPSGNGHGFGVVLVSVQDVTIEHNTWAPNMAGDGSSAVQIGITQSGSLSIQNNVFNYDHSSGTPGFSFNTSGQAVPIPAPAPGAEGNTLLSYLHNVNLNNNVFLCTWSNDQPGSPTEITPSTCSSEAALYPANNYFPSGTTLANRVSAIGWNSPLSYGAAGGNYRLTGPSPYIAGGHLASDGLDIGANIDQLEAAQGKVSNVHAYELSSTGATLAFLAPDSMGLTVDWGTSAFWTGSGAWTRVTNAGGQRAQTVALTGLPAHGLIYYRVNGAVMQPTGTLQLP